MSLDPNHEQENDFLSGFEQDPGEIDEAAYLIPEAEDITADYLSDSIASEPFDYQAFDMPQQDFQNEPPAEENPDEFTSSDISSTEQAVEASDEMISETEPAALPADNENDIQSMLNEFSQKDLAEAAPVQHKKKKAIRKGRPRRKNGEGLFGIPNILVTIVWCALTLLISLTLGRLLWVCAAEVLAFGREDKSVTITVYETDTIDDITKKLARAELIRYPGLFKLYAQFAVDEGEIRPGMWDLNTKYDYHALVKMMSPSSSREVVKVTIPEGYTCRQIFDLLEENKVCTKKDIEAYAATGELDDYWFLEGVERGSKYCLEGFLFPDTYEFYQNDSPKNALQRMLNNFNNRFDENMQWGIQTLNNHLTDLMRRNGSGQDYINSHLFTVKDVVNVASMIEKETSSAQEGYTIASVIYNRLFCWGSNPPYLNIDATIVYALDGKTDLTSEDLRVDSPYNTYTNLGLTPGPISNPGLSSLKAALDPQDTNYYFYVLDPSVGSHHFSTTQAEHDAFRASLGG